MRSDNFQSLLYQLIPGTSLFLASDSDSCAISTTSNKMAAMDDWISLDVGGRKMSTSRSTLLSNPTSVLAMMFDPDSGQQQARMVDGSYVIDADPDCFQVLLNWLRYKTLIFPTSVQNYEGVSALAGVFGIHDLMEHIKSVKEGEEGELREREEEEERVEEERKKREEEERKKME